MLPTHTRADHPPAETRPRARARRLTSRALTGAAALVLFVALVLPDQPSRLAVAAFLRIPLEGLVLVAVASVLPAWPRRILAGLFGTALGLLAVVSIVDLGYYLALDRPFDLVSDWGSLGPAFGVLRDSVGRPLTIAIAVAAVLLLAAVLAVVPLAALRTTRVAAGHRAVTARALTALTLVWVLCAAVGLHVAHQPVAATSAARLAYDRVHAVSTELHDQHAFTAALSGPDPVSSIAGSDLLTGLRGKDVIIAFVESYGQVAVENPTIAPGVDRVLRAGTTALRDDGFASRSAFVTSPTFGGISWLAHSTLQSGLWIDTQRRYDQLVASQRFTLSDAFGRAGWRTVDVVPEGDRDWPPGTSFYHYDTVYDSRNLGYAGPRFSYTAMPDQYTLAAFRRLELTPGHAPVMAEIDLLSSHTPWTPLPHLVPWSAVGDGSVFDGMPEQGPSKAAVWSKRQQVQASYGQSVQYSLQTLISFVQTYGDDNLVLILLGDHQPATIVSGANASHNAPITVIARDPHVMGRIASWGWQDGMLPGPGAPVWRMDTFRDRFLTTFDAP